jgi:hypothetical protein
MKRWAAVSLLLASCGPTRSSTLIVEASAEVAAAQTAQAPSFAPYEYVAAEGYLHKAREEQSYADFEVSEKLAKKARDCAKLARTKAEQRTRKEIGASVIRGPHNIVCRAGPVAEESDEIEKTPKASAPREGATPPPEGPRKPVKPKEEEPSEPLPEGEDL